MGLMCTMCCLGSTTGMATEREAYVTELPVLPDSVEYDPRQECVGDSESKGSFGLMGFQVRYSPGLLALSSSGEDEPWRECVGDSVRRGSFGLFVMEFQATYSSGLPVLSSPVEDELRRETDRRDRERLGTGRGAPMFRTQSPFGFLDKPWKIVWCSNTSTRFHPSDRSICELPSTILRTRKASSHAPRSGTRHSSPSVSC